MLNTFISPNLDPGVGPTLAQYMQQQYPAQSQSLYAQPNGNIVPVQGQFQDPNQQWSPYVAGSPEAIQSGPHFGGGLIHKIMSVADNLSGYPD